MNSTEHVRERSSTVPLIDVIDVTKEYHKGDTCVTPLNRINVRVNEGEFVALMGPSGSGKTTLLNLIAGIDRPTSGKVVIGGSDISTLSRGQLARWRAHHVGYIFQLYHLVPVLTAYENVELPLLLHHLSRRERQTRVNVALEAVGLLDRYDHYPRQLSGGQEQRVAIARALVTDPMIIVADEPTGDLDKVSADATLKLLKRLNKELGKTLVMVTHDPTAASVAERIIHLDKGVISEGPHQTAITAAFEEVPEAELAGTGENVLAIAASSEPMFESSTPPATRARVSGRRYVRWAAAFTVLLLFIAGGWLWSVRNRTVSINASGEQVVKITVDNQYYPSHFEVAAGKPVLLKITKETENSCADQFMIPEYKVRADLVNHQPVDVRFTPTKAGVVAFQCGMDMMHGEIFVTDAGGGQR